jgi:hypothetical protein
MRKPAQPHTVIIDWLLESPGVISSPVRSLFLVLLLVVPAYAQWLKYPTPGIPRTADGKADLNAPAPKAPDGKPDLTGLWMPSRRPGPTRVSGPQGLPVGPNILNFLPPGVDVPPMLPAAAALYAKRGENFYADRPSARCLPHSIPDQMLLSIPVKIVQTPGLTMILYEEFTRFRQVFTDGRPHPPVASPAWLGYSIGKWEGDWFVVDTRGFNDKSWLDDSGRPHSEALRTIERFRRRDFGHMDVEITIDDPETYTKPFTIPLQFEYLADTDMIEDVCDNEKDAAHTVK